MTAIDRNPGTLDFLNPIRFSFSVRRLTNVSFFVQRVNLPGIAVPSPEFPNPLVPTHQTGDHVAFEPLSVTFLVDEDMANFREVFDWMVGQGYPTNSSQRAALESGDPRIGLGPTSDATLTIMSSAQNPLLEIRFVDAHPIALSLDTAFSTTSVDVEHATATVEFAYTYYTMERVRA